ncbi:hypothetical protein QBC38DRAFT_37657 [Podospora fimiseda]|uniref:Uncharacterized protein n=1 Tax=Podospora fimiseda TaxID=252190 RepID=A0AAN7BI46_9PEZI|nr:hypothetical protein QBC38DRAFT_37657 [Podospora fimiseda]
MEECRSLFKFYWQMLHFDLVFFFPSHIPSILSVWFISSKATCRLHIVRVAAGNAKTCLYFIGIWYYYISSL